MKENHLEQAQKKLAEAKKEYHKNNDVRRVLQILREARGYILDTMDFFAIEAFQKFNFTKSDIEKESKKHESHSKRKTKSISNSSK